MIFLKENFIEDYLMAQKKKLPYEATFFLDWRQQGEFGLVFLNDYLNFNLQNL